MSDTTIEKAEVELDLDISGFEQSTKKCLSLLGSLKESLTFDNVKRVAVKSVSALGDAIYNACSFSYDSVYKLVHKSFGVLGSAIDQITSRITSKFNTIKSSANATAKSMQEMNKTGFSNVNSSAKEVSNSLYMWRIAINVAKSAASDFIKNELTLFPKKVAEANEEMANSQTELSAIQEAAKNINSTFTLWGKAIQETRTKAAKLVSKELTAIPKKITGVAKTLYNLTKSGGMSRALNIQTAQFQLKGLGIAWETVKDDITYAVKDTAFGLDSAATAAGKLSAAGVQAGNDLKAALRGISGLAAMTNQSYDRVALIYSQVAATGSLLGQDLMQLNSLGGVNVVSTLAKELGKTNDEIRDMISKRQIDFKTFATAMDNAFGEQATKANETFTGALSNMKAALSKIGADIADPFYTNARNVLNALRKFFDQVKKAIETSKVYDAIKKLFNTVGDELVALIGEWTESIDEHSFEGIAKFIFKIEKFLSSDALDKFITNVENVVKFLVKVYKFVRESIEQVVDLVKPYLDQVLSYLVPFAQNVISVVYPIFTGIIRLIRRLSPMIEPLLAGISDGFMYVTLALGELSPYVAGIVDTFIKISNTISKLIAPLGGTIYKTVITIFQVLINIGGQILTHSESIANLLVPVVTWLADKLRFFLFHVQRVFNYITIIATYIGKYITPIANHLYTIGLSIHKLLSNIFGGLVSLFVTMLNRIIGPLDKGVDGVMGKFLDFLSWLNDFINGDLNSFLRTLFQNVAYNLGFIVGTIKKIFTMSGDGVSGLVDLLAGGLWDALKLVMTMVKRITQGLTFIFTGHFIDDEGNVSVDFLGLLAQDLAKALELVDIFRKKLLEKFPIIGTIGKIISTIVGVITTGVSIVFGIVSTAVVTLVSLVAMGAAELVGLWERYGGTIKETVLGWFGTAKTQLGKMLGDIAKNFGIETEGWQAVADLLNQVVLPAIINFGSKAIDVFKDIWSFIQPILSTIISNIIPILSTIINTAINLIQALIPVFQKLWTIIKPVAKAIIGLISTLFQTIVSDFHLVPDFINQAIYEIQTGKKTFLQVLGNAFSGVVSYLQNNPLTEWFKNNNFFDVIGDFFGGIFDAIGSIGVATVHADEMEMGMDVMYRDLLKKSGLGGDELNAAMAEVENMSQTQLAESTAALAKSLGYDFETLSKEYLSDNFVDVIESTSQEVANVAGEATTQATENTLNTIVANLKNSFIEWISNLNIESLFSAFNSLKPVIIAFFTYKGMKWIGNIFNPFKKINEIFNPIKESANILKGTITTVSKEVTSSINPLKDIGKAIVTGIGEVTSSFKDVAKAYRKDLNAKAFSTYAGGLVEIAIGIGIVSAAFIALTNFVKIESLDQFIPIVGVFVGIIAAITLLTVAISKLNPHNTVTQIGAFDKIVPTIRSVGNNINSTLKAFKMGGFLLSFAASVLILAAGIKSFSNIDFSTAFKAAVMYAAFLGEIAVANRIAGKFDKFSISYVLSLALLPAGINAFNSVEWSTAVKAAAMFGSFLTIITGFNLVNAFGKAQDMKTFSLSFAVAVPILAYGIEKFKGISFSDALPMLEICGSFFAGVAIISKAMKSNKPNFIGAIQSVVNITQFFLIAEAMAATISAMTFLDDEKLLKVSKALSFVFLAFSAMEFASGMTKYANKVTLVLITTVVAGLVALLVGLTKALEDVEIEKMDNIVDVLGKAVLVLSATYVIFGVAAKIAELVNKIELKNLIGGLWKLIVAVGFIGVIITVVGLVLMGLLGETGLGTIIEDFCEKGGPVLITLIDTLGGICEEIVTGILKVVGTGIGEALGSLVGAFEGSRENAKLGELEEGLNKAAGGITNIGDALGGHLSTDKVDILDKFADAIDKLAATGDYHGEGLQLITSTIPQFATALMTFVNGIDTLTDEEFEKIDRVTTLLQEFVNVVDGLPETGGILQNFTGWKDLGKFADDIGKLGEGLAKYHEALTYRVTSPDPNKQLKGVNNGQYQNNKEQYVFNDELVTSSANAAKILAELNEKLPESGGKLQDFLGQKDLEVFAKALPILGGGLAGYYTAISAEGVNFDADIVRKSAQSALALATLNKNLPESGGKLQKYLGDKDLAKFGEDLGTFGESFATFITSVSGIEEWGDTDRVAKIGTLFSDLEKNLSPEGGFIREAIFGDKSLDTFGQKLTGFAQSLIDAGGKFGAVNFTKLNQGATFLEHLLKIIGDSDWDIIWTGSYYLDVVDLVDSMAEFFEEPENVQKYMSIGETMIKNIIAGMIDDNSTSKLPGTVSLFVSKFAKSFESEDLGKDFQNAGTNLLKGIGGAIKKLSEKEDNPISKTAGVLINLISSAILELEEDIKDIGGYIGAGIALGMLSDKSKTKVFGSAKLLGNRAIRGLQSGVDAHSPSREAEEVGENVGEGLILGLDRFEDPIYKRAQGIGESVVEGMVTGMKSKDYQSSMSMYISGVFGNIDLNNRQAIKWTEDLLEAYGDTIDQWGGANPGDVSTVLGGSADFTIDDKTFTIAFSPMLQTPNGAKILDKDTVNTYLDTLLGNYFKDNKEFELNKFLAYDRIGIDGFDDIGRINSLVATAVESGGERGNLADVIGEVMHLYETKEDDRANELISSLNKNTAATKKQTSETSTNSGHLVENSDQLSYNTSQTKSYSEKLSEARANEARKDDTSTARGLDRLTPDNIKAIVAAIGTDVSVVKDTSSSNSSDDTDTRDPYTVLKGILNIGGYGYLTDDGRQINRSEDDLITGVMLAAMNLNRPYEEIGSSLRELVNGGINAQTVTAFSESLGMNPKKFAKVIYDANYGNWNDEYETEEEYKEANKGKTTKYYSGYGTRAYGSWEELYQAMMSGNVDSQVNVGLLAERMFEDQYHPEFEDPNEVSNNLLEKIKENTGESSNSLSKISEIVDQQLDIALKEIDEKYDKKNAAVNAKIASVLANEGQAAQLDFLYMQNNPYASQQDKDLAYRRISIINGTVASYEKQKEVNEELRAQEKEQANNMAELTKAEVENSEKTDEATKSMSSFGFSTSDTSAKAKEATDSVEDLNDAADDAGDTGDKIVEGLEDSTDDIGRAGYDLATAFEDDGWWKKFLDGSESGIAGYDLGSILSGNTITGLQSMFGDMEGTGWDLGSYFNEGFWDATFGNEEEGTGIFGWIDNLKTEVLGGVESFSFDFGNVFDGILEGVDKVLGDLGIDIDGIVSTCQNGISWLKNLLSEFNETIKGLTGVDLGATLQNAKDTITESGLLDNPIVSTVVDTVTNNIPGAGIVKGVTSLFGGTDDGAHLDEDNIMIIYDGDVQPVETVTPTTTTPETQSYNPSSSYSAVQQQNAENSLRFWQAGYNKMKENLSQFSDETIVKYLEQGNSILYNLSESAKNGKIVLNDGTVAGALYKSVDANIKNDYKLYSRGA